MNRFLVILWVSCIALLFVACVHATKKSDSTAPTPTQGTDESGLQYPEEWPLPFLNIPSSSHPHSTRGLSLVDPDYDGKSVIASWRSAQQANWGMGFTDSGDWDQIKATYKGQLLQNGYELDEDTGIGLFVNLNDGAMLVSIVRDRKRSNEYTISVSQYR